MNARSVIVLSMLVLISLVAPLRAAAQGEDRDDWQRVPDILGVLGVEPGARIADVGAGGGYFTVHLSRAVGDGGRVFAVDVVESTLQRLGARLRREGVANVELILGRADDPRLPFGTLDGALIVNAYHEMHAYASMLSNIRTALRPGGRLVIVDNPPADTGDSRTAQTERHEIAVDLVEADLRDAGFEVLRRDRGFIDQDHGGHRHRHWMLVAARPEIDAPVQRLDGAAEGPDGFFSCGFPGSREELVGRPSPPDSTELRLEGGGRIKLCYGSPSARGRTIMGGLVPFGRPWRTGADEPTRIRADVALTIGDASVPAGWHSIYTIPGEERWTVVVNRLVNRAGIPIDEWVRSHDVGRLATLPEATDEPVESLTMTLRPTGPDRAEIVLEWERTRLRIPVERSGEPDSR